MDITSNYSAPLGLPNGQTIPPRGSVVVPDKTWSELKDHVVVKAWIDEKKIATGKPKEGEKPAESAKAPAFDDMNDDQLRIFLKEKDVAADGRWARERLLAEAKKAATKD